VETGIDGFQFTLQCLQILELGDFMSANYDCGLLALNKGPSDVVVAFGNNIPRLILIGIPLSLEDGEFASNYFLWSQLIDLIQQ
jgi:hypothetical protein